MNVSWDFCRWHCWGIHCWSCIYCLNVPCYKRYNLIKRNYLLYLKNLTMKRSHSGSNFLSTHIHFFPCESTLPFLRYGSFKIWPWKFNVKVRLEVKGQGTQLAQQPFDDLFILRKSASNYYDMTHRMFNPLSSIWPANIFNAYIYIFIMWDLKGIRFFLECGKVFPSRRWCGGGTGLKTRNPPG